MHYSENALCSSGARGVVDKQLWVQNDFEDALQVTLEHDEYKNWRWWRMLRVQDALHNFCALTKHNAVYTASTNLLHMKSNSKTNTTHCNHYALARGKCSIRAKLFTTYQVSVLERQVLALVVSQSSLTTIADASRTRSASEVPRYRNYVR